MNKATPGDIFCAAGDFLSIPRIGEVVLCNEELLLPACRFFENGISVKAALRRNRQFLRGQTRDGGDRSLPGILDRDNRGRLTSLTQQPDEPFA